MQRERESLDLMLEREDGTKPLITYILFISLRLLIEMK